jgi:E2/UBC family protein C/ThiF family protein
VALADYFQRSAVAAAQVLAGFDEGAIRERLEERVVGITFSDDAGSHAEGRATLDLATRLLARLYPRLAILGNDVGLLAEMRELAVAINPAIELSTDEPDVILGVGRVDALAPVTVFAGSDGWDAHVSSECAQSIGETHNPFGAGVAACLAAANVFRAVFLRDRAQLDAAVTLSTLEMTIAATTDNISLEDLHVGDSNVLVGVGAIGNAVVWALARSPLEGSLALVDHQTTDLSNLQRYVLTRREDDARSKVEIAAVALAGRLRPNAHRMEWSTFVETTGHHWQRVLVALDSARHRRAVQASLPRWIANAWTQPGDLGVSTHSWTDGACLACLYLPQGAQPNEDRLIAQALGIARPDRELQIRNLLHANSPPPREMLEEVAQRLDVSLDLLLPFENVPLRALYTEGICGGAVLPLDRMGAPRDEFHVPVAHQSALAGVLLAARFAAHALGRVHTAAEVARLDVMQPVPTLVDSVVQPAAKDPRGVCVCQDEVYADAYSLKYG